VHGKLKRRWDRAQTPYQRLLASGVLAPEQEARLAALHAGTNPRQLRDVTASIGPSHSSGNRQTKERRRLSSGNIPK